MNDLYQPYFNLILNPLIPRGGQTQPSPEEMSLHRYPSEFLTRQSFDARALTSPPFPLSQHLSRSRGVPDRYRQCASDSAGTKTKKAVKTDPGGNHLSCEETTPQSGSEPDLTAFSLRFPVAVFARILNGFQQPVSTPLKINHIPLSNFHHFGHHRKQTVLHVQVVGIPANSVGHRPR